MDEVEVIKERAEFYGFLTQFTQGTTPCRDHLEKVYKGKLDKALEKGYVEKFGENSIGEPIYRITEFGKYIRDSK